VASRGKPTFTRGNQPSLPTEWFAVNAHGFFSAPPGVAHTLAELRLSDQSSYWEAMTNLLLKNTV
jgi:hypothetical protein